MKYPRHGTKSIRKTITGFLLLNLITSCGLPDPNKDITDKNIKTLKQRLSISNATFENVVSYSGKFEATCGKLNGNHFLVRNGEVFYTGGTYGDAWINLCCTSISIYNGPTKTQSEAEVKENCDSGLTPALGPTLLSDYELEEPNNQPEERLNEKSIQKWQYDIDSDEMSTDSIKVARIQSTNKINLRFPYDGEQRATLNFRKHPRHGTDAWLSIEDGQLICQSIEKCQLMIRFDDGKAIAFKAAEPQDNRSTALFILPYKKLYLGMLNSKRIRVEANFYQEGSQVLDFNVENFDSTFLQ